MEGERAHFGGVETAKYIDIEQLRQRKTMDDLFTVLSNSRRRFVLSHLCTREEPVELCDLAKRTKAYEADVPFSEVDSADYRSVYTTLYQNHLPMLDSLGVVDYDEDEHTVELSPSVRETVHPVPASAGSRPWHTYYGLVSLAGGLLVGTVKLVTVSVLPLFWHLLALFGVAVLLVLSTLQYRSERRSLDESRTLRLGALV